MGPRDIVHSGNIGTIVPIRTIKGVLFREFQAHAPPGKFLRLKFSEKQSSALSKCLDSILNM